MNEKLIDIINQILNYKGKSIQELPSPEMNLRSIGFDSLDLAELTVRIENEYGVDVFADGIVDSFGEIYEKINANR